jgi:hypothetical protein
MIGALNPEKVGGGIGFQRKETNYLNSRIKNGILWY